MVVCEVSVDLQSKPVPGDVLVCHADWLSGHHHGLTHGLGCCQTHGNLLQKCPLGCQCQFPEFVLHFVAAAELSTDLSPAEIFSSAPGILSSAPEILSSAAEGGKLHPLLQLVSVVPSHFLLHLQLPFFVGVVAYGCGGFEAVCFELLVAFEHVCHVL
jgi:hypothetical protein